VRKLPVIALVHVNADADEPSGLPMPFSPPLPGHCALSRRTQRITSEPQVGLLRAVSQWVCGPRQRSTPCRITSHGCRH
jgi:hypothetical protein